MDKETIINKLESSEHYKVDTTEIVDYAISQILKCNPDQIAQSEVLTKLLTMR